MVPSSLETQLLWGLFPLQRRLLFNKRETEAGEACFYVSILIKLDLKKGQFEVSLSSFAVDSAPVARHRVEEGEKKPHMKGGVGKKRYAQKTLDCTRHEEEQPGKSCGLAVRGGSSCGWFLKILRPGCTKRPLKEKDTAVAWTAHSELGTGMLFRKYSCFLESLVLDSSQEGETEAAHGFKKLPTTLLSSHTK